MKERTVGGRGTEGQNQRVPGSRWGQGGPARLSPQRGPTSGGKETVKTQSRPHPAPGCETLEGSPFVVSLPITCCSLGPDTELALKSSTGLRSLLARKHLSEPARRPMTCVYFFIQTKCLEPIITVWGNWIKWIWENSLLSHI